MLKTPWIYNFLLAFQIEQRYCESASIEQTNSQPNDQVCRGVYQTQDLFFLLFDFLGFIGFIPASRALLRIASES